MNELDGAFTVLVIDGDIADYSEIETQALRYDGLLWPESVELVRLSFMQGFTAVIWKHREAEADG